ncbi:hypothetical protein [Amycolatopsis sp. NPDC004378]
MVNPFSPAVRTAGQLRAVALVGVAALALATATGWAVGITVDQVLVLALGASLVLWVGGAVSGQVLLARLLDHDHDSAETFAYLRRLLWIIPRFYVPVGVVAAASGAALAARTGTSFADPHVWIPLALYLATAVLGAAVSAPGYVRILRDAEPLSADHEAFLRRLVPLSWVNRVELCLVLGTGFTLLAATT